MSQQLYYVCETEQEAQNVCDTIVANIKAWVQEHVPEALSDDGNKLKGRNAKTGELVNHYTTRWAIPKQRYDGKWVVPRPTQTDTGAIPVLIVRNNINAEAQWFRPQWFPESLKKNI